MKRIVVIFIFCTSNLLCFSQELLLQISENSDNRNLTGNDGKSYIIETQINKEIYKTEVGSDFRYAPILDDYLYFKKDDKIYILASIYYWTNGIGDGRGNCASGQEIYLFYVEIGLGDKSYKSQQFQVVSCLDGIDSSITIDSRKFDINETGWMSKSYNNFAAYIENPFNEIALRSEKFRSPTIEYRLVSNDLSKGFVRINK